jgi:RNA polymerase sigma-70 factor (ECF subfamily)
VVDGIPLDLLTERMGTNRNALYQTMFDARRKIRRFLEANGYVDARKDG